MYDFNKLVGLIIEKYGSRRKFAELMDLSETSIYCKLNNKIEFKSSEIEKACYLLEIPKNKINDYFFAKKVQKNQTF